MLVIPNFLNVCVSGFSASSRCFLEIRRALGSTAGRKYDTTEQPGQAWYIHGPFKDPPEPGTGPGCKTFSKGELPLGMTVGLS